MKTIVEYKVMRAYTMERIESCVNDLVKEGWQPLGGISVVIDDADPIYAQAVVKYD